MYPIRWTSLWRIDKVNEEQLIGSLSTGENTPLLIYAILLHIYYKGIRATYYFHNNKLANY